MALDQSVLSDLADMLKSADGIELVREAVRLVFQELIEAELAEQIGVERYERSEKRTTERNGHQTEPMSCPPRPETSASASRSSGREASSPPSSSLADGSTRRFMR